MVKPVWSDVKIKRSDPIDCPPQIAAHKKMSYDFAIHFLKRIEEERKKREKNVDSEVSVEKYTEQKKKNYKAVAKEYW